ncbi:protein kinase domain-containing protein [Aquisphaera insulae]|uniref:protein kinase domain-containing protein n=1 Tax=Aquisphaera insulae TaxID=2712864 RepID=UPI0013EDF2A3|nr:protein kinase [Aquisphaera insulae]
MAHYRVKRPIGEGATSLVFLAEDTHLARPVALKVIRPELADGPEVRERFVREAQALAAIRHDHIVTIYQVGRDGGVLFLAMECLRGVSLQGWLERGRKPSTELILRLGREIASGLAAAHREGLVHRDIKPANIWLEAPSGRVKILDFGMARSERDASITHAGTVMGTPAYMAPEQARGEAAGPGSDLFSLGCVLYRLCVGKQPFEGGSILAVLSALASETPRTLREIEPDVNPALDDLVMRLLAKDPSARPASAQAVVEAIKAIELGIQAERQTMKPSDVSHQPADGMAPAPVDVTTGSSQDGLRREPRPKCAVRTMAGVLAATVAAGAIFIARQRQVTLPAVNPAPAVIAFDAARSRGEETTSALPQIDHDRPNSDVALTTVPGKDAKPLAGRAGLAAILEANPGASRQEASTRPLEDRPPGAEWPPRQRIGHEDALLPPSSPMPFPPATVAMPSRDDWGPPIDPDGDCTFEVDDTGHEIRIAVPGTPHVLSAELGRRNAPRLLRPMRGDFDVIVNVTGVSNPSGRATMKEYAPYHGAGILLWQDEGNYLRLEIAADIHRGKPRSYANFELRKGGSLAVSRGLEIRNGSTRLRLERRGTEVRAAFGPDGVFWTWFSPMAVDFDDELRVGIVAINSATKPLNVGLEVLSIAGKGPADGRLEGKDGPQSNINMKSP